jgi:beta-lactamase superfamily II metal-dependent hydrolase
VIDRYKSVGAEILRTDLDGQIEIVTDGISLHASRFVRRVELIR